MSVAISEQIKQFRINNNLTLDRLAQITGVSRATLGRIENGISNPTTKTIQHITNGIVAYSYEIASKENVYLDFSIYSPEELASILEFNQMFLGYRKSELFIGDSELEIVSNDGESTKLSYSDLKELMDTTINSYFNELEKLVGFSFDAEPEAKSEADAEPEAE